MCSMWGPDEEPRGASQPSGGRGRYERRFGAVLQNLPCIRDREAGAERHRGANALRVSATPRDDGDVHGNAETSPTLLGRPDENRGNEEEGRFRESRPLLLGRGGVSVQRAAVPRTPPNRHSHGLVPAGVQREGILLSSREVRVALAGG